MPDITKPRYFIDFHLWINIRGQVQFRIKYTGHQTTPLNYGNIHILTCGGVDIRIVGIRSGTGLSPSEHHHLPGFVEIWLPTHLNLERLNRPFFLCWISELGSGMVYQKDVSLRHHEDSISFWSPHLVANTGLQRWGWQLKFGVYISAEVFISDTALDKPHNMSSSFCQASRIPFLRGVDRYFTCKSYILPTRQLLSILLYGVEGLFLGLWSSFSRAASLSASVFLQSVKVETGTFPTSPFPVSWLCIICPMCFRSFQGGEAWDQVSDTWLWWHWPRYWVVPSSPQPVWLPPQG